MGAVLKKYMLILAALSLTLSVVSSTFSIVVPSADASPAIFSNMDGNWRGSGRVKATAKGKLENIRCRMNNSPNGSKRINLGGNCAVSGFVFSLRGFIEQTGSNTYRASMFRSLANIQQSMFAGKRSGNRINFSFRAKDRASGQDVSANIRLNSVNAQKFNVDISRTDPQTGQLFKVGTIAFSKR